MNNEIYSLNGLEHTEGTITAIVRYDAAHPVFTGHFPDNPIVPGVCTLNMISDIVRDNIGRDYIMQDASNVKFLQLIRPANEPSVRITWKSAGPGILVNATVEEKGTVLMRFAGTYSLR